MEQSFGGDGDVDVGLMGCFNNEETVFFSSGHSFILVTLRKAGPSQARLQDLLTLPNTKLSSDVFFFTYGSLCLLATTRWTPLGSAA